MWNELFLNTTQILKLKEIIVKIFSSVESERFWDIFIHFDKISQEGLYERIKYFYEAETPVALSWNIFKNEPNEYIAMSREIFELFDGILFFVKEDDIAPTLYEDLVFEFYLLPLDYEN